MYTCGPTVYAPQHLGNLRSQLFADLLKRVLLFEGYTVRHVINITDVGHLTGDLDAGEDKLELAAAQSGRRAAEIAAEYTAQWLRTASGSAACPRCSARRPTTSPSRSSWCVCWRRRLHLSDRRRHLLRHFEVPALQRVCAARPLGPGRRRADRGRPGQAPAGRLRALEVRAPGCAAAAGVGFALGPRLPRLAPRVLRDGLEIPGAALRHPYRGGRPRLRAPHQRDRAERVRLGRASLGGLLVAQRVSRPARPEDGEVDREPRLLDDLVARGVAAARLPALLPPGTTASSRPSRTRRWTRLRRATTACSGSVRSCARRRGRPIRSARGRCASASAPRSATT
jgi:hypothetical protein